MNKISVLKETEIIGKSFKIYGSIETPFFQVRDIIKDLNYSRTGTSNIASLVDEDEKVKFQINTSSFGETEAWFLTEIGLYELLALSRKPQSKQFKKEIKAILCSMREKNINDISKEKKNVLKFDKEQFLQSKMGIELLWNAKTLCAILSGISHNTNPWQYSGYCAAALLALKQCYGVSYRLVVCSNNENGIVSEDGTDWLYRFKAEEAGC